MDSFLIFWLMFILLTLILTGGLIYLAYWLPKRFGYKKAGIGLAGILTLLVLAPVLSFVLEDVLFFKSDAIEKLQEHQFTLKDDFSIESNKITGISDFYHRFELSISERDKVEIIRNIKERGFFQDTVPDLFDIRDGKPRYSDSGVSYTARYRDDANYVYEFYQPNKKGTSPTLDRILVSKKNNKLVYERILD